MTEQRYRNSPNGSKQLLCCASLQEGKLCNSLAIKGRQFCKFHGGKAALGIESAAFKTGLWSAQRRRFASVAPKLLSRIDELRDDPELFSLKDDAAYLTALMDVRAEAASEGISLEHYNNIRSQFHICSTMLSDPGFTEEFSSLGKMIRDGIDMYTASQDVVELIEKRTKVIETEQKMMHTKAYTLEVDQAYSLIMQVLGVIKASVKDPEEMTLIRTGITKLLKTYQEEDIIDAEVVEEHEAVS
jgi:hypothetical protein